MLVLFAVAVIALLFVYGAVRIIMGWVLPAEFMRRWDAGVGAFCRFYLKLMVVIIGLGIIALVVYAARH